MPVYKRRYYLGLLNKSHIEREEQVEKLREETSVGGGKGNKKTKISGTALKNRINSGDMKNGEVPS
jgi:hypothetical protein